MKKLALTIAIVLTMGLSAFAQYDEDKFGIQPWFGTSLLGKEADAGTRGGENDSPLILPGSHGGEGDVNAPLGTGIAVLVGLGAAYAVAKKRKEK